MLTTIIIAGIFNLTFAIFHLFFWKLFGWNKQLPKLGFVNSGIMQILNIQLIFYFIFSAIVCFICYEELSDTRLGHLFLLGNSIFWLLRTIQQFIFFKKNHYAIHILTVLFICGSILFALPLFLGNQCF
jgi:hypothetical protein